MRKSGLLIAGFLILFTAEILRVYFIMPFPGSQKADTIQVAYFLDKYIWWFRILAIILIIPQMLKIFRNSHLWRKIVLVVFVLLYATIFYFFNFKFLADKMFYQPQNKILATVPQNKIDSTKLVIGVTINGQSKAYPVEIIGYHHQVQDTVGGEPVMITYCTVCRTGRVYSPFVNGKFQKFRLVGMDHFNAMFEDESTKSWWRQATGVAVTGKLKGTALKEIASVQMTLGRWIQQYPATLILQPDPLYIKQYKDLDGFDEGTINSGLEKRDSGSWKFKSWVVGIKDGSHAKAYDWNNLQQERVINDTFHNKAIVLVLQNDNKSFDVWSSQVNNKILHFNFDTTIQVLKDTATNSVWNMQGECIEGVLKGSKLSPVQAYQEFWHSWQAFHPATTQYFPEK